MKKRPLTRKMETTERQKGSVIWLLLKSSQAIVVTTLENRYKKGERQPRKFKLITKVTGSEGFVVRSQKLP